MRLALKPHPDTPCAVVRSLQVEVARPDPGALVLTYGLAGAVGDIALPPPAAADRADELWRTTCFEAFVKPEGGDSYLELNFASSSRWAAYRFVTYREGMAPLEIPAPSIVLRRATDALEVAVRVRGGLPPGPCRLALSAIIEDAGGARSFWALAHPPGRPDFHADAAFVARLPSPEGGGDFGAAMF